MLKAHPTDFFCKWSLHTLEWGICVLQWDTDWMGTCLMGTPPVLIHFNTFPVLRGCLMNHQWNGVPHHVTPPPQRQQHGALKHCPSPCPWALLWTSAVKTLWLDQKAGPKTMGFSRVVKTMAIDEIRICRTDMGVNFCGAALGFPNSFAYPESRWWFSNQDGLRKPFQIIQINSWNRKKPVFNPDATLRISFYENRILKWYHVENPSNSTIILEFWEGQGRILFFPTKSRRKLHFRLGAPMVHGRHGLRHRHPAVAAESFASQRDRWNVGRSPSKKKGQWWCLRKRVMYDWFLLYIGL